MAHRVLTVMAVIAALTAPAFAAETASIQPAPDSPAQRQTLKRLTACLANARPGWAKRTLALPYLSEAQASLAAQALQGRDSCVTGPEAEITFRTSGMVGSLAEHYLTVRLNQGNYGKVIGTLASVDARNVSEDFGLCVASRNPTAARELVMSEPGSADEGAAADRLAPHLKPCTKATETLTVDLQALRALVSVALYRGLIAAGAA